MGARRAGVLLAVVGLCTALGVLAGCGRGDFALRTAQTTVAIPQGRTSTQRVTVTRTGGFQGEITFSVRGLVPGIEASFNPVRTTATGTQTNLTLRVDRNVAVGTYKMEIIAAGARNQRETSLEVRVQAAPDFSMTTSPAVLTMRQGTSDAAVVTVTRTDTLSGLVALEVRGAPPGITASLAPSSTAGTTSTLSLMVDMQVAPGTYPLTIRGIGDGLERAIRLDITVEPSFSVALSSNSITSPRGGSSPPLRVTVLRGAGFEEPVALALKDPPSGVTAEFSPNPVATGDSSTLTLTVSEDVPTGVHVVGLAAKGGAITDVQTVAVRVLTRETLSVSFPIDALDVLPAWERVEQMRDWVVYAFLVAQRVPAEGIAAALYDQPPQRQPALSEVFGWQYGNARWVWVDDDPADSAVGDLYAFLPDEADERLLGGVADDFRRATGRIPDYAHMITYALDETAGTGSFALAGSWTGSDLYNPEGAFGYRERSIRTRADLEAFLGETHDLVYAEVEGGVLRLGGRTLPGKTPSVTVEDVATLYQAYLQTSEAARLSSLAREFSLRYPRMSEGDARSLADSISKAVKGDSAADRRAQLLLERYGIDARTAVALYVEHFVRDESVGFSLDPGVRDSRSLAAGLLGLDIFGVSEQRPGFLFEWIYVVLAAEQNQFLPLHRVMQQLAGETTAASRSLYAEISDLLGRYASQCARYDGDIQGTSVGMTLFYTDLLAKLWIWDFAGSTPRTIGMSPELEVPVSSVFWEEIWKYPSGRLWFGTNAARVRPDERAVLFSPVVARIYSAADDPDRPGEEVKPTERNRAWLQWWESYWPDIMAYEPEYFRLNQITKLSFVMRWLLDNGQMDALTFLGGERISRDLDFETWLRTNQHRLTFTAWLPFVGKSPTGTECLSILCSETQPAFGSEGAFLSGGVSLTGQRDLVAARSLVADPVGIRSELARTGKGSITSPAGASYAWTDPGSLAVKPGSEARFRAPSGEVARPATIAQTLRNPEPGVLRHSSLWETSPGQILDQQVVLTHVGQVIVVEATGSATTGLRVAGGLVGEMRLPWNYVSAIYQRPETGDLFFKTSEGWFRANAPEKLSGMFAKAGSSERKAIIGVEWVAWPPDVSEMTKVDIAGWSQSQAGLLVFEVGDCYAVPKGPGDASLFLFSKDSDLARALTDPSAWPTSTDETGELTAFFDHLFSVLPDGAKWEWGKQMDVVLRIEEGVWPSLDAPEMVRETLLKRLGVPPPPTGTNPDQPEHTDA